ncbi:MAG: helix-turn-helix transcriptional regulator [Xanthobacteraceae bacterium]|nr:helix-turn-helix transcriptional regulator [Xanthobacteraceae bacterium]
MLAPAPNLTSRRSIEQTIAREPSLQDEDEPMLHLFGDLRPGGDLPVRVGMAPTQQIADALSVAGHPIALLGRDGAVIHMNARFERLVGDGLCMRAGRLGSWQPDADQALATAIGNAVRVEVASRSRATTVLPRRNGLRPLVAEVVSLVGPWNDGLKAIAAIVTLTDLESVGSSPSQALLEQAFGLTPAEARLASQIAAGKTLADIAADEGNARETLRSRLKSVFHKTGTGRQAELTLLLSRLARF